MKEGKNFFGTVYNAFGSLKFAVIVLIILGIASIVAVMLGTFFPAGFANWETHYVEKYGQSTFALMRLFGVFDPYHSFWYTLLLALLTILLTVCSLKRLRGNVRAAFGVSFKGSLSEIQSAQNAHSVEVETSADQTITRLKKMLQGKFFRVRVKADGRMTALFADKWGVSRLGSFLMHSGLVIAVFGGLIASLLGYSTYYWGGKGEIIAVPDADYEVRIDQFEILENELGQIKDYLSTVTVWENGDSLFSKIIEVNHPLRFRGLNFYQSSYRPDDRHFEEAVIAVRDSTGEIVAMVKVKMGERSPVAATPYSLQPLDFAGNFIMRGKEVLSDQRFSEFRNPAIRVNLYSEEELLRDGWIFSPQLAGFHPLLEAYRFELLDVMQVYQTGLRVTWNPGSTFIWIGMITMTIGVCLTFFLSHRRIWAVAQQQDDGKSLLAFYGLTRRDKESFERQLQRIESLMKQEETS